MRKNLSSFSAALGLTLLAACARNPQPGAPAPQAAPAAAAPAPKPAPAAAPAPAPAELDLSGDWSFVIDLPGQRMTGLIQLRRSGSSYAGTATPADIEGSATLTSLSLSGNHVIMTFDSPEGEARADAVLSDPKTMNGTVNFGGNTGPFSAHRL